MVAPEEKSDNLLGFMNTSTNRPFQSVTSGVLIFLKTNWDPVQSCAHYVVTMALFRLWHFSIVVVDDVGRVAGTEERSVSPPAESLTSTYHFTTALPQRQLHGRSKQVTEICYITTYLCFSEANVNAFTHIFVQQSQMSHRTEVVYSPGGVETDGQARGIWTNQMPYLDNSPDR